MDFAFMMMRNQAVSDVKVEHEAVQRNVDSQKIKKSVHFHNSSDKGEKTKPFSALSMCSAGPFALTALIDTFKQEEDPPCAFSVAALALLRDG